MDAILQGALPVAPGDPWIPAEGPQPLQVEISHIKCYERNPRRLENPEYDRIRASIHARGMDRPLSITHRPGEADYVVQAGGNTRLRILKELHAHTGEARFARVYCLLLPWTCESDVLLAHLRENELRGNLPFIDKAQAVMEARDLLTEERGTRLTQRKLEVELRAGGYSITHGRISLMEYAVTQLLPWIPEALGAGLGKLQVARIRALERGASRLWQHYCADCEEAFGGLFTALCQRYDGPDWDIAVLQCAVEAEIAQEAELDLHTVRTALDAELEGRIVNFPEPEPEPQTLPASSARDRAPGIAQGLDPETACTASMDSRDLPYALAEQAALEGPQGPDLASLRQRAWVLAERLAERAGLGDLVRPLPDQGCGFVLDGVPVAGLDESSPQALRTRMLWWQLAACSELTSAPAASLADTLSKGSKLRRAIKAQDIAWLEAQVDVPDPAHTGACLWSTLHEQDWNDLIRLMDTYRRLRLRAHALGEVVWPEAP